MIYRQNIAIIGLFTSFNVETARVLADDFGLHFLDANRCLEYTVSYSIRQIIEDYGNEYFIKCERKFYKEFADFDETVIGCSATAMLNASNIESLRRKCYIIMLTANENISLRRFRNDPDNNLKDLITDNYDSIIQSIHKDILPLCDIVINTDRMTPVRAATKVGFEFSQYIQQLEAVKA